MAQKWKYFMIIEHDEGWDMYQLDNFVAWTNLALHHYHNETNFTMGVCIDEDTVLPFFNFRKDALNLSDAIDASYFIDISNPEDDDQLDMFH